MKYILRLLLASALALAPVSAQAASGATTVSALDAGSTSRTFNVFSTTGAVSGNLSWMNNICDITTLTVCAAVDAGHSLQVAGEGTAGNAAGGVVTIQGVALMTPILATVTGTGTFVTQSAITAASGSISSGAIASGAIASGAVASGAFASGSLASGAGTDGWNVTEGAKADAAYTSGSGSIVSVLKGIFTSVSSAIPAGSNNIGVIDVLGHAGGTLDGTAGSPSTGVLTVQGVASGTPVPSSADPCASAAKTNVPISTASGTVALVAGVSAKKIYVCSFSLVAAGAISVSLSEGSGTTCGTSAQAGVIGVATNGTAANGMALSANGGLTLGNGGGTIAVTATAANYLCLFQSGTTQLAGNLTYVQQ